MKAFVLIMGLLVSQFALAQGLILSTLGEKPDFLTMERMNPFSGPSYFSHIEDEGNAMSRIVFKGNDLKNLEANLMRVHSRRIFCDGEYELVDDYRPSNSADYYGGQYLKLEKINVCIDENGWIVARSMDLENKVVQTKANELAGKMKAKKIGGGVFEGTTKKETVIIKKVERKLPSTRRAGTSGKRTISNIKLE